MRKNFILDTNVLLYDPESINQFADNNVIIPVAVIEELDGFKRDVTELGRNSRAVALALDHLSRQGKLGEGVKLDEGGLLRIHAGVADDFIGKYGLSPQAKVGNHILNLAVFLNEHYAEQATIIITKNINLRLTADSLGIYAEDYQNADRENGAQRLGYHQQLVHPDLIKQLDAGGISADAVEGIKANEYVRLIAEDNEHQWALGRHHDGSGKILPIKVAKEGVCGIGARNFQQSFALDALLDERIKLVSLIGRAGTGKTLLAVAAGLHQVIHDAIYTRILISRPTMPMGRDIGFIPGDIEEKMRPWMQPIYDAVEMIRDQDRRSRARTLPPNLMESDELGIEPLTYIRGRSIPHQFFIIDEAQNLTPHEVKTIITRVGHNSKIVLTGDPDQIDNPYVDLRSNGFSYLVDRFGDQSIAAHITLTKGERSELAEIAANVL